MLIIAELSQREKRVHNRAARGQNTKLIHEVEEMIVEKVFFSPLYMFDIIDVSNIKNWENVWPRIDINTNNKYIKVLKISDFHSNHGQ